MSAQPTPILQLESTYRETLRLIEEARAYALTEKRREAGKMNQTEQLTATMEALRVTTRLTNVMSWLLARKAVLAGEMDAAEAVARGHVLGGRTLCLEEGPMEAPYLSERLKSLMLRSLEIYQRIDRLDQAMCQGLAGATAQAPGTGSATQAGDSIARASAGLPPAAITAVPPGSNVIPLRRRPPPAGA